MTLDASITALAQAVGEDIKALQALVSLAGVDLVENSNGTAIRLACGIQVCFRVVVGSDMLTEHSSRGMVTQTYDYPAPFLTGAPVARFYGGHVLDAMGNTSVATVQDAAFVDGSWPPAPATYWQGGALVDLGYWAPAGEILNLSMLAVGRWRTAP